MVFYLIIRDEIIIYDFSYARDGNVNSLQKMRRKSFKIYKMYLSKFSLSLIHSKYSVIKSS